MQSGCGSILAFAIVITGLAGVALMSNESTAHSNESAAHSNNSAAVQALSDVQLANIPFIAKKPDFGGEACVAMCLRGLGKNADQDVVFDASSLDPVLGRGCVTKELTQAVKKLGFETGSVFFSVANNDDLGKAFGMIFADLKSGRPTVVCRVANQAEQFVLVTGYDKASDQIVFHDPNVNNGENKKLDRTRFLKSCLLGSQTDANGQTNSTFIALRMNGSNLRVPTTAKEYTDADYAQHIRKLKNRLPHQDFHIILQKPFVVVGDGTKQQVQRASTGTVKWAVDAIKKDYFSRDPYFIIDVWLFKNPKSYQKHNLELWNSKPGTPYGYYSPANRVLVMDISTGGGTLVHEIVHPFMESNFQACPSWFNEGLASLYEQSSSRNGHIVGLTNWRLRGLQLAIEDGRLPSFKELCSTSTREFYDGHGTNYAQARYLCYYLQEKGLLNKYFHDFRKNAAKDPSGYETLKQTLGRDDIDMFQKQWEAYVLKLRFGR